MVKLVVRNKETKEVLYCYQSVGDPANPSEIHESGTKLTEFKKRMDEYYTSLVENDEVLDLAFLEKHGYTNKIDNMLLNIIDNDTMEQISEGWEEDLKKYPPPKHEVRQHGAAFGFARF